MIDRIKSIGADVFSAVVALRRQIHSDPELAYEEFRTSALVAETLGKIDGVSIRTGVAKTGVIAEIEGGRPGPTIVLRADMDALPILEENTFDFVSQNPGKMHACGHDAHTSSLLGTAMILSRMRDEIHGSVRMLFQPSEEKLPGGAKPMIEEGCLEGATSVLGQHVTPRLEAGTIGVRSGPYMASADELYFTVIGEGGHAAEPHSLQADAVVVAAELVTALQTVASRKSPPGIPTILSIGRFIADGATNVIPASVRLEGTLRTMDEAWRKRAHKLIEEIATHVAAAHGARCEVEIRVGYPVLVNDETETSWFREAAAAFVGEENVVDLDLWYASEDFAYYSHEIPGVFYRLGTGNERQGIVHRVHTPRFTIDEEALRIAPGLMAFLALRRGAAASE
ncbi:MAG: amidohydrolase [Rhodothermales bacterium]